MPRPADVTAEASVRPPEGAVRGAWDGLLPPLLAAAAGVLVFLRSAWNGFAFDDHRFIEKNPFVQDPQSPLRFLTDAATVDPVSPGGIVRPLRTIEFALDRALFGPGPLAFHLHSLLWFGAGAALLVLLLRRLVGDGRLALLGGLLWAVNPVQTESVALVSSRGDLAMGACTLASILFALRTRGRDRDLALSLLFAALGALYKETAVVLPLFVVVLRWTGVSRAPWWPYALVSGAYLVYRASVQVGATGHGVTFELGGGTAGTFATMIRAFGFYLVEPLLPAHSLDWYMTPSTGFADAAVLAWAAVHAAILASAVRLRASAPLWTLAVAWFYVFLLPVANWPWFGGIPTAERFLHVSLGGFALAAAAGLRRAGPRAVPAALVAAAAFAAASVHRTGFWKDDDALWSATLASHPSPRALVHTASRERERGLAARARAAAAKTGSTERERAMQEASVHFASGLALYHRALALWYAFEGAPHSKANFARVAENDAAQCALLLGRFEEALFHADEALAAGTRQYAESHYNRAQALLALGFAPQAADAMRRARDLGFGEPDDEMGRFFLRSGRACEDLGLPGAAEASYATAIDAAPPGPLREEAYVRLAALQGAQRDPSAEGARRRELDARLAATPVRCPERP